MRFDRRGERGRRAGRAALLLGAAGAAAALVCLAYEGTSDARSSSLPSTRAFRSAAPRRRRATWSSCRSTTQQSVRWDAGRWPHHADAIQRISRDQPLVIAYDVQFSEKGPNSRADRALLEAVRHARRIVLATTDPNISGSFLHSFTPPAEIGNTGLPDDPSAVLRRMGYSVGGLKSFSVAAAELSADAGSAPLRSVAIRRGSISTALQGRFQPCRSRESWPAT